MGIGKSRTLSYEERPLCDAAGDQVLDEQKKKKTKNFELAKLI